VSVTFEVICLSVHGALEISTLTTGESLDPDGFEVSIDNGAPRAIGTSASISLPVIAPGEHTVTLSNVASNCTLAAGSSQSVSLSPDEPAAVRFSVTCSFIGITIWNAIPLPPLVTAVTDLRAGRTLWGTSPSDLFVIGQTSAPSPHYGIWHYDGSGWTEQVSRSDAALNGLWGFSSTDVYAVGNSGVILHYDGSRWSDMPGPLPGPTSDHLGIWGAAAEDVFLSARAYSASPGTPLLAHFDGSAWSTMATPVFGDAPQLTQMAGTSGSDVWAIGFRRKCDDCNYTIAMVVHYDGQVWTEEIATNAEFYYGVWAIAPNDVWVVGENGYRNAYVLHFDGTGWAKEELSTSHLAVQDVWASSGSDVYAVGPELLLHYDGEGWSTIPGASGAKVWGISREDVFILREHAVLHGSP
jgi:hypothetical protein